jgi:hypothetical protein
VRFHFCGLICLIVIFSGQLPAQQATALLSELRSAQPAQRAAIVRKLQSEPTLQILDVVSAMSGMDPVQKNLLLGVAQTSLDRNPKTAEASLQKILADKNLDPAARYWAFTVLSSGDSKKRDQMLETMLEDPALELRYEAVKLGQSQAAKLKEGGAEAAKLKDAYQKLLASARLPEQIQEIADSLKAVDVEVDLLEHFGFISEWQTIGPFANLKQSAFDVVYGPEKEYLAHKTVNLNEKHDGKAGKVAWQPVSTKEKDGGIDLNPVFNKEKGAIAYAFAEFNLSKPLECQVRLGCINANKVWVNGELKLTNEVYHAGSQIDQYVAPVKLIAGKNTILIKACQNEQTESWAQDWKYQLRFTDASGMPIRQEK